MIKENVGYYITNEFIFYFTHHLQEYGVLGFWGATVMFWQMS